ncbi:MAG: hypothetical protein A2463_02790 [Candidatus Staskawiczbacteria bacterium RIFOXYC2_FULL_32_10]|nr:MAG: hypothetical protein A2463_02790 [Candidatus Staskawiczbacteria bacterium RIFOXYC2_FULL_32_10]
MTNAQPTWCRVASLANVLSFRHLPGGVRWPIWNLLRKIFGRCIGCGKTTCLLLKEWQLK